MAEVRKWHRVNLTGVVTMNRIAGILLGLLIAIPCAADETQNVAVTTAMIEAVNARYIGTQDGPMGPLPASGKTLELPFMAILRFADGKIAELWVEWDNLSAFSQLGHFPPPEK